MKTSFSSFFRVKITLSFLLIFFLTLITFLNFYSAYSSDNIQNGEIVKAVIKLNSETLTDSIIVLKQDGNYTAEVKKFIEAAGGKYYSFNSILKRWGFIIQYGKILSFTRIGYDYAFNNTTPIKMEPPCYGIKPDQDSVYMAPLIFLENAVGGSVEFNEQDRVLSITANSPAQIGSVYPGAADFANEMTNNGFLVRDCPIKLVDPIDLCATGYIPDCNGNNARFPYFLTLLPPKPGFDTAYDGPMVTNIDYTDALVTIGKTPPPCKYYSYRSYLVNRYYDVPYPMRVKIYASMGDTKSLYNTNLSIPTNEKFEKDFAIITTADSITAYKVRDAIIKSTTIPPEWIFIDVIPHDVFRFGLQPISDWGNLLHRVSLFLDSLSGESYKQNPTLEVIRISSTDGHEIVPLVPPPLIERTCGTNEFHLLNDIDILEYKIFNKYKNDYQITWLMPSVWLCEGLEAIQERLNVLGEGRDALYTRTSPFKLGENDKIVIYGVNHVKTGKGVYCNASCYGASMFNGFGGIENTKYVGTAREFINDTNEFDKFYVYNYARNNPDHSPHTFIVPQDTLKNLRGIDYDSLAFMGFRIYCDTTTKVGPSPMEVIMDRAMLLTPKTSGAEENQNIESIVLKVIPNPVHGTAIIKVTMDELSDIMIDVFDLNGKQITELISTSNIIGEQNYLWNIPENILSGIYYLRLCYYDRIKGTLQITYEKIVVEY